MKFKQITVYIDYRFKAGESKPKDKSLRARVKMGHGLPLGSDLCPQWIKDIDCLKDIALQRLVLEGVECESVLFEIDPIVGLPSTLWKIPPK